MIAMADRGGGWRSGGARLALWGFLAGLLTLPAIAMRFRAVGVDWTASDFVVMGVLLGAVGLGVELVVRASSSLAWRAGAVVAVLAAFFTIWVNLAVGMVGSEDNPFNFIFLGVLALALAGALFARFRAAGMAKAMLAAAIAQAAAGAAGFSTDPRGGTFSIGFAFFWLLAAGLFALASRPSA
ncbi:MAG: hypothetical protein QOH86_2066 [Sphingomonadales bacterium]|jgi:hypothetical protein|nr:hypothetical protein [Sphingomonadales bacterium]